MSRLPLSRRRSRFLRFPREAGMLPSKSLLYRNKSVSPVNLPNAEGISPVNWLLEILSVFRFARFPTPLESRQSMH